MVSSHVTPPLFFSSCPENSVMRLWILPSGSDPEGIYAKMYLADLQLTHRSPLEATENALLSHKSVTWGT